MGESNPGRLNGGRSSSTLAALLLFLLREVDTMHPVQNNQTKNKGHNNKAPSARKEIPLRAQTLLPLPSCSPELRVLDYRSCYL